ncbi:DUF2384 domain-containing protein [Candidatus Parcubacteria bacterium]|nr:DUF2384 domain-containing protein [Candidatus Parcubacteria bacterium]
MEQPRFADLVGRLKPVIGFRPISYMLGDVSAATLEQWERGDAQPPTAVANKLQVLMEVFDLLWPHLPNDRSISIWLVTPAPELGGLTPLDYVRQAPNAIILQDELKAAVNGLIKHVPPDLARQRFEIKQKARNN